MVVDLRRSASLTSLTRFLPPTRRSRKRLWVLAALLVVVALFGLILRLSPRNRGNRFWGRSVASTNTVAVLPFQNMGRSKDADFLRFAIPDEVVTSLSYFPSVVVRPFSVTRKYVEPDADPERIGRELHAVIMITGQFLQEGDRLTITVDMVEAEGNRLLVRGTVSVPAQDLIAMRAETISLTRKRLLPILNASAPAASPATEPKNREAYDLFLRSAALSRDPLPNKQSVLLLERAVALDPGYAPAWAALGRRYYTSFTWAGSEAEFLRSRQAYKQALRLDPNLVEAAADVVTQRAEIGDLNAAYEEGVALAKRRPDSAAAHFALSYVLRYGGLLEESAQECDLGRALDPSFYNCALTFIEL